MTSVEIQSIKTAALRSHSHTLAKLFEWQRDRRQQERYAVIVLFNVPKDNTFGRNLEIERKDERR